MPHPRPHPDRQLRTGAYPGPDSARPRPEPRNAATARSPLPIGTEVRPRWRGRLHLAAFVVSLPAGAALYAAAGSTSARIAVAVYSLTVSAVFGVSAAFHLLAWSRAARRRMDRLDRAMIYLHLC
jgi:hemolysin III